MEPLLNLRNKLDNDHDKQITEGNGTVNQKENCSGPYTQNHETWLRELLKVQRVIHEGDETPLKKK